MTGSAAVAYEHNQDSRYTGRQLSIVRGADPLARAERIEDVYTRHFRNFAKWARENGKDLNGEDIREYFRELNDSGAAVSTIRVRRAAVKRRAREVFTTAGDIEQIARIEAVLSSLDKTVKAPKKNTGAIRARVISTPKYGDMMKACTSEKQRLFIRFLWETGCRVSEMTGARLDRCKEEGGRVSIAIMGKGRKERIVRVSAELFADIRRAYPSAQVHLFETAGGRPYLRSYVARDIGKIGTRAGIHAWPHLFRHSFATRKISETGKIKAVSEYLGHSSTSITLDMYTHEDLTDAELFGGE